MTDHHSPASTDLSQWLHASQARLPALFRELQQQLRENAAGFGTNTAPQRQLDPLPLLIAADDWQVLEAGMLQRQRLLQLVLNDVYGAQQTIRDNLLPAEALFRAADYLLPAAGLLSQPTDWLPLLSLDLAKDAAGQWQVLADHAVVPAGLGHLVEHRLAFNHAAPLQGLALSKAQIAGFYRQLLQLLQPVSAETDNNALAGLWITSVRNADYFEQAYLANYLDIALVHGADLTFRDGSLWLKTLTGLQSISALLRFLPDPLSDPLELEPGTAGCAGLLQSIRQQQLCCVNPPGSSLIDSGVLAPFLPRLCQELLGEPLLLPQATTLWLGEAEHCVKVMADLTAYRLQRISSKQHYLPVQLDADALTQLSAQIVAAPADHIAIVLAELPPEPCWQPDIGLFAAACTLRLFSLSTEGMPGSVLPGGYARLSTDGLLLQTPQQATAIPTRGPQLVKDVWVLADRGVTTSLLHSSSGALELSRHSGLVTSRVADHLFWLGRYNERLNQICRALRAALGLASQHHADPLAAQADMTPLLRFCLQANGHAGSLDLPQVLHQLFDPAQPGGLFAILQSLLLNAQSAREFFAADTWLVLDKLQQALRQWPQQSLQQLTVPGAAGQYLRQLDEIILLQTALYGLNNETMSRTQALRLMDLGQHIERGMQTAALLQIVFVPSHGEAKPSAALMEAVLRLADTVNTYRRRYRSQLHPLAVIDLLVFDDSTPRSVGYQCLRIQRQCAGLPVLTPTPGLSAGQRLALELVTLLQLTEPQSLFDAEQGATPALGLLLSQIQHRLKLLSDSITLAYFNHAPRGL